jgi:hypothetical protein
MWEHDSVLPLAILNTCCVIIMFDVLIVLCNKTLAQVRLCANSGSIREAGLVKVMASSLQFFKASDPLLQKLYGSRQVGSDVDASNVHTYNFPFCQHVVEVLVRAVVGIGEVWGEERAAAAAAVLR